MLRRPWVLGPVLTLAVALVVGVNLTTMTPAPDAAAPEPSNTVRVLPARMAVGVTHTQYSADEWHPKAAVRRAVSLASGTADVQNQSLMGWGTSNPEPSPGVYDWRSLDQRVALMRRSPHSVLSITLCGAPDWMKGGVAGQTRWSDIEKAPTPEHYDDFAALAAAVARRYPDVEYFFVWNELKGFYDPARNDWDIAAYTELYNRVHRALKAVRSNIKVGGPYVPMDSWSSPDSASHSSELRGSWGVVDRRALTAIQYWLEHNAGADLIAVDAQSGTQDRGLTVLDREATDKFAAITRWIRRHTPLPVWWVELYALPNDAALSPGAPRRAQLYVETLVELKAAGAAGVLLWQPEAHENLGSVALWTSTERSSGGTPLPVAAPVRWLRRQWDSGVDPEVAVSGQDLVLTGAPESMTLTASGAMVTTRRTGAGSEG